MKGINPTKAEKAYWDLLVKHVGCVACLIDSNFNGWCSIHHTDGRTKSGCHKRVLPLCGPHHQQDDTDPYKRIAVHPNKAKFEAKYGTQAELVAFCDEILAQASKKQSAVKNLPHSNPDTDSPSRIVSARVTDFCAPGRLMKKVHKGLCNER